MADDLIIMDGGMGRELERMGAPFQQPEWSALALMEAPEFVTHAHQSYIDAGAEVIITNSYALVPYHIGQERFDTQGRDLIKLAAKLARDIAGDNVRVAGCIPPAFGSYRPDLFIEDKAESIYRPMIEEQEPFVDLWIAETVSSLKEVHAIAPLLKDSKKPFWLAYTVHDRHGEDIPPQLRSGESIEKAINIAHHHNVDGLLFNCSHPEEMEPVLKTLENIDIPYGAYANAFEKTGGANDEISEMRTDCTPDAYLEFARTWHKAGATIIGGCCGIGPEHIKALQKLKKPA